MTFSFNADLSTDLDKVRLTIGDTSSNEVLLADETIETLLLLYPGVQNCSLQCINAILARESRSATDRSVIGISTSLGQRYNQLLEVRKNIESTMAKLGKFYATGVEVSFNTSLEANTNIVQPHIERLDSLPYSNS